MSQPARTQMPASMPVPDPYPPYRPVYAWVFQSWLIMFLAVICAALAFYLLSYVPR